MLSSAVLSLSLGGCAQFIDDCTAVSPQGDFMSNMHFRYNLLFHRPPPMEVLASSQDGDERALAYRRLRIPGGNSEEQTQVLSILAKAAREERDLVCRLAATEKLGESDDPRVIQAVADAFYAPANATDQGMVVRVAAVNALAQLGNPESAQLLADAAAKDPQRDVRMAALKGLGQFQGQQATNTLVQVLKEEKDVAMRFTANASLQKITGRELPPEADQWEQYFQNPAQFPAPERSVTKDAKEVLKQVSFWE
jgi:hypothetical protein